MKNQTSAIEQLDRCIRARYPVITILSHEESWVMASIGAVAERRMRRVVTWTCTQGLQQVRPEGEFSDWRPDSDLQFDADMTREVVFVDLPSLSDRKEIVSVHLAKRNLDPTEFDINAIA